MFAEDLTPFFQDMATNAILNGVPVIGIFKNEYLPDDLGGDVAASQPVYILDSDDVPANVVGLSLVIGSVPFKVVSTMPDGTGVTTLQLRK